ncbi:MAG: DNA polymerase III subunit delta [Candidatus Syntrophosphaera sp.]
MASLDARQFVSAKVRLGDNFLLLGGDAFLNDVVTDHIRLTLRKKADVDLVIIYADDAKTAEINDLLDTYSIFSKAKLVMIRTAEALKKEALESLAAYFDDPSDQQSLVIVAQKPDFRVSGWKKIKGACQLVRCDPPKYGGMFTPWLDNALAKTGKTMTAKAKNAFINRVELDYANANNELIKLTLLVGDKKEITEADVMRSIGFSRVGTQIDFFRALGKRQAKEALELLDLMLTSEFKPLQVLFQIVRFYRIIYFILLLKKNHISNSEIKTKYLGELYDSQRPEFLNFADNYDLRRIEKILPILLDTDARIKSSNASHAIMLTTCILKVLDVK